MRERQGDETATPERSSRSELPRRRRKRQGLILAALTAILVGVVIGWLAYSVLDAHAAPLPGVSAGGSLAGSGHNPRAMKTRDVRQAATRTHRAGPVLVSERGQRDAIRRAHTSPKRT